MATYTGSNSNNLSNDGNFSAMSGLGGQDNLEDTGNNPGLDTIDGGTGNDYLFFSGTATGEIAGGAGNDSVKGFAGNDQLYGGDGNDVIWGDNGNDQIDGGAGTDRVNGANGNDTIHGGAGDDNAFLEFAAAISTTHSNNILGLYEGGLYGDSGNDEVFGDGGVDRVSGGNGDDVVDGGTDDDQVFGDAGNDEASGGGGSDGVYGGDGNDVVRGNSGNDALTGDAGNDKLDGGDGDDGIRGGIGKDMLAGGDGADTFSFLFGDSVKGKNADLITDFGRKEGDVIDLAGIDANTNLAGDQAFDYIKKKKFTDTEGELRYKKGKLTGDVDGDGKADFMIKVADINKLGLDDFLL